MPSRDPQEMHDATQRDIAALALGEPIDAAQRAHMMGCPTCQADVAAYRHIAGLARAGRAPAGAADQPPAHVWARIVDELGLAAGTAGAPAADSDVRSSGPRRRPATARRRVLVAAAAVVALVAAGAGGWAVGHAGSPQGAQRSAQARLAAQPGTAQRVHGTASVHPSALGHTLTVDASGLPATAGYYEVWLFDPSINQMVAVGSLGDGGRGSFTVPAGLDLASYHVVDVSAQRFDGNNRHERSVLRGPLGS